MATALHYSNFSLKEDAQGRFKVEFHIDGKRFRFTNGSILGHRIYPNRHPKSGRKSIALDLAMAFKQALNEGWNPAPSEPKELNAFDLLKSYSTPMAITPKYANELEQTHARMLSFIEQQFPIDSKLADLKPSDWTHFLNQHTSTPSTFNHERQRVQSIVKDLLQPGAVNPINAIAPKKIKQSLHRPIENMAETLADIKEFNGNLYLCCLMTYGCLLRPHREIRELKWADFLGNMEFISLPGKRNKSGRNRIVPVPEFVRAQLEPRDPKWNIFSHQEAAYNADYFKSLWTRYKSQSNLIAAEQTLYSFRHTGAIEVYKRTKDIAVVQQVMGHASLLVTLRYLRNLEIPMLRVEDMPTISPSSGSLET